ncbi:hypothetical protein [Spongiactinospora sp. 9N601]|uniref:hypothetical protein n=1 Tax=Spongiactinospora sp. 9N601 TaxID=3375149 RepID=UPI00378CAE48
MPVGAGREGWPGAAGRPACQSYAELSPDTSQGSAAPRHAAGLPWSGEEPPPAQGGGPGAPGCSPPGVERPPGAGAPGRSAALGGVGPPAGLEGKGADGWGQGLSPSE